MNRMDLSMKEFIKEYMEHIIPVSFVLVTPEGKTQIGKEKPEFTVTMHQMPDKKALLTSTSLALGEAYMKGDLEVDRDLYQVLDLFKGQMSKFSLDHKALKHLYMTSRSKSNQKEEVTSHYDIGNDFYRLWLDDSMSYSCGYFKQCTDSLYEAQVGKVDHILEKLQLKEGMTLLDIGCGWGFLLKRAVVKYGVKGVGITLSEEQYKKFSKEIKDSGMEDKLSVKLMDYRDLKDSGMQFDRIVSVGMIEHVGRGNYELFLDNVNAVLKSKGLFLLRYIGALKEHDGDAFIKKYIFPGGIIPSLREIITLLPDYNFYTLDVESLRRHYTRTLLCWRDNFLKNREKIVEMQGEEFTKMWELYLTSCAATFHNGIVDLYQVLVSKDVNNDLPMIRKA